jgi:hypothetical protein
MGVNRAACTITIGLLPNPGSTAVAINDSTDGCPTIATGDYLYAWGTRNKGINGISDWIPSSDPASNDSFLSVNRSADTIRLSGLRLDGTSGTLEEVLESACANVSEQGGELSHFFMSFKKYADLAKSLGSKAQLVDVKVSPTIGYEGIKVVGSGGPVVCIADRACPSASIFGVNIKDWQLNSIDEPCHIWDLDGNIWLRSSTQSGQEIRFYSLANLVCKKPVSQINITVNA